MKGRQQRTEDDINHVCIDMTPVTLVLAAAIALCR